MAKTYTLVKLEAILKAAPALIKAVRKFNKVMAPVMKADLSPKADLATSKKLLAKLDALYGTLEERLNWGGDLSDICSDLADSIEELEDELREEEEGKDVEFAVVKNGRVVKTVDDEYKPKRGEKLIPMDTI